MLRLPLLLSCAASACAAIPGVPAPPRPGPFPSVWLWWGNDAFGGEIGDNADDYRTNEIAAQALIGRRWLVALDHSMLTNKESDLAPAGRSDEITASVGVLVEPMRWPDWNDRLWLAAGVGGRAAGDFGGADGQNALHEALGYRRVELPYGDDDAAGLGYATGGWLLLERFPFPETGFLERGQIGGHLTAAGAATTAGEGQVEVGLALVVLGVDGAGWVGPRYRWSLGEAMTPAADAVAERERGWWLDYGAGAGGWFVTGGVNLEDHTTLGAVGWSWGRQPGRAAAPRPAQLEADLGWGGGFEPGVQFRWQPAWLRRAGPLGERAALLADYRFGAVDDVDWGDDAMLSFNQAVLGLDLAWSRPRPGWQLVPFARVGAGVRYEVVRERGPDPRFESQSAATGVALAGAGVRLSWGRALDHDHAVRYSVAASYDGWLPFDRATARNGDDSDQYLRPGSGPGIALTTVIAW